MDGLEKLMDLCTEKGTHKGLAQKLFAFSNDFTYEYFCDERKKMWLITDRSEGNEKIYYSPFGDEVARTINAYTACNPNSPLYVDTLNRYKGKRFADAYTESINSINDNMGRPISDFLELVKLFDIMHQDKEQGKIGLWSLWHIYRYINYVDLFPLLYSFEGTDKWVFAQNLVHNKISRGVFMDYTMHNNSTIGHIYKTNDWEYLFCLDLFQVLVTGAAGKCKVCPRCGRIYFSDKKNSKYCPMCKKEPNKIKNENRKKDEIRYLHKRILDRLSYLYDNEAPEYVSFIQESNFYWDVCQGKKPQIVRLEEYQDITTKEQYMEWLTNKFQALKQRRK